MKFTIQIYRHLYNNLPPLFPEEIEEEIKQSLERFENNISASLEELENEMVKYGYFVWPWRMAYRDYLEAADYKIGEHFLLSYLDESLQDKYNEFKACGGTWHDLHSGRPAEFFTSDERMELMPALVETKKKIREYVDRDLVGLTKQDFLKKVEKYDQLLGEVKIELINLREFLAAENDHPVLVEEMRGKIRDIEHSLCLLGNELRYDEIKNMQEFFKGRREDLNRMRGIHLPVDVDFFNMD